MRTAIALMLLCLPLLVSAQGANNDIIIDDFEKDTLGRWQNSVSPEYYRGGEGNEALSIMQDPERGRVLRAAIAFGDEKKSEPIWITREVDNPLPVARVVSASFWYKVTGVTEAPINSLVLRLRTSPTSFTDHELLPETGMPLDQWTHATVDIRGGMSTMRNIYNSIFADIQQVTLRLDDVDEINSSFSLLVDDIRITLDQPRVETYQPSERTLRRDGRLDVLLIRQSAAGYYDIEAAARTLDPDARVDSYLFRGLHFPLWGFPERIEDLVGYDLIVFVDVDPWVMTAEQAQWLADLAYSGAGMIVFGGPNTLTQAKEFKLPLRQALPVTFEPNAKSVGGGTPTPTGHPLAAALPAEGLGAVPAMHDVILREGAQAAFTVGERPLVACGEFGKGRVALVNSWPTVSLPLRTQFLTSDLSDDLLRALLRWGWRQEPRARLTQLHLPSRTVVAPGRVQVTAAAEGASRIRLRVDGQDEQIHSAGGPVTFPVDVPEQQVSEQTLACRVEALDAAGQVADWRDFAIETVTPLGLRIAWVAHQEAFLPGGTMEFSARLSARGMPQVVPSGSSLDIRFADGSVPVSCSGLADIWVIPEGSDKVLHDQLGPSELATAENREGLLPVVTTTGITRAHRTDGSISFGADNRIQRVERIAAIQPDGGVRITSRYEFLQDVKVSRITTMLTLPTSIYAGMTFVAEQGDKRTEGVFPVEQGKRLFDGTGLKLTIQTPAGPLCIEVLDPTLHVWMQDLRPHGMDAFRLEIEAPFEGKLASKGDTYEVPVLISSPAADRVPMPEPGALSIQCELLDPGTGKPVVTWPQRPATDTSAFTATLPDLHSGEYRLSVRALDGDRIVSSASTSCSIVDPLDRTDFFPVMTYFGERGGGHDMDAQMTLARLDDIIAHGFNAVTAGNARTYSGAELPHGGVIANLASTEAQRRGLATFFEYHRLTLVTSSDPVAPCVYDPVHREKLEEYIEPMLDVCRRVPRLLSIKILDEPHLTPGQIDMCDRCKTRFRELYGTEFVGRDELGEDIAARWRLADFLGQYVRDAYAMTREIKEQGGGEYDLLLTYCSPGLGYGRGFTSREDTLNWSREAGMMDFDIYPYFYPSSQKVRMVGCNFGLSIMREYARHLGKPWGFYVELDDRNWPYQQNPPEASAECAWTAIAHGANYLNSFIHTGFGTGTDARPERWEMAGEAFRAIRRIGPLLNRMRAPKAPLAMIYPMGQAKAHDGSRPADYALECLRNGFGMTDVVCSEVLSETDDIADRACYVLLGCEILERSVAEKLTDFCAAGGRLILDRVPATATDGKPLDLPWSFEGAEVHTLPGLDDCTYRVSGSVTMLGFDLNAAYREAIEGDQLERAAALRRAVGIILNGVPTLCFADDAAGQIEAGLRTCEDGAMVVAVNHLADENTATLRLRGLDFEPAWACDLSTMQPVRIKPDGNGCTISIALKGRHSQAIALLPEAPAGVDVTLVQRDVKRGDRLSYRAHVLNAGGKQARGCHLLEIEVTGPDGQVVTRFGGSTATENGEMRRAVAIPVNAPPGEYHMTVSAPQAGKVAEAGFTVAE